MISKLLLLAGLSLAHAGVVDYGPQTYGSRVLAGNVSQQVKAGSGVLRGLIVGNNASGGQINVYDGTSAAGTLLLTVNAGTPSGGLLTTSGVPGSNGIAPIDLRFSTGLFVVTSGSNNNNFTLVFQ